MIKECYVWCSFWLHSRIQKACIPKLIEIHVVKYSVGVPADETAYLEFKPHRKRLGHEARLITTGKQAMT